MAPPLDLIAALRHGPLPAGELVQRLGISRPTLSRLIAAAGGGVFRYGSARATHYAARRSVAGRASWPIYRVAEDGHTVGIATLHAVEGGYLAELHEVGRFEFSESLPWWLQDMRPQGFLGRALARRHAAALNLPDALSMWTDDHALTAIVAMGDDTPGNLLVGDDALAHYLAGAAAPEIPLHARAERYPVLATAALAGEVPGSSAGGEQPKFSALIRDRAQVRAVLVKFSSAADNPISRRWASLLVAEHHALRALHDAGIPASRSELIEADGQLFLQVERFDRVSPPLASGGTARTGRRGVVSLAALDDALVGRATEAWPRITERLVEMGHITPRAHWHADRLYAFGLLIGNTDMHRGNLSFLHTGGILECAPAYDMLPMHYAPRVLGEMSSDAPDIRFRTPPSLEAWREMLPVAQNWARATAADPRLEETMRGAILGQLEDLKRLAHSLGG